jgi:hypothetical protein
MEAKARSVSFIGGMGTGVSGEFNTPHRGRLKSIFTK